MDRSGLLRDISAVLADEAANVTSVSTRTDKKTMQSVMDISLDIRDLPTLSTAISRLEQIPNVVSVRRAELAGAALRLALRDIGRQRHHRRQVAEVRRYDIGIARLREVAEFTDVLLSNA